MRSGAGAFLTNLRSRSTRFTTRSGADSCVGSTGASAAHMFVRMELTLDFLGDLSGKSVLDIGCGSGIYMEMALKRGASHVTGIDPAEGMLRLARERVTRLGLT